MATREVRGPKVATLVRLKAPHKNHNDFKRDVNQDTKRTSRISPQTPGVSLRRTSFLKDDHNAAY